MMKDCLSKDTLFKGREWIKASRPISLKIHSKDISVYFNQYHEVIIPFSAITGWEFFESFVCLTYSGLWLPPEEEVLKNVEQATLLMRFKENEVLEIQKLFNLSRVNVLENGMGHQKYIQRCSLCDLLFIVDAPPQVNKALFCPECYGIFLNDKNLTQNQNYHFNFCRSGLFTLLGRRGALGLHIKNEAGLPKSLYEETDSFKLKCVGNFLWTVFWFAFAYLASSLPWLVYLALGLFIVHLFLMGSSLTQFLLLGGLSPLMRKPKIEKITSLIFRKKWEKATQLIKKYSFEEHPGVLANLATAYYQNGLLKEAEKTILKAIENCPNHPMLFQIAYQITKDSRWQTELNKLILINLLPNKKYPLTLQSEETHTEIKKNLSDKLLKKIMIFLRSYKTIIFFNN